MGFISIQQSSGIFAKGYRPCPVGTGYEYVLAHRTDEMFASTAKGPGKVTSVSNKAIVVDYDDGTSVALELGRVYGTVAALTLPHNLVTALKVGDKVEAGQVIAYNDRYFELDPITKKQAVWKAGCLANVALMESSDTYEDSCAISSKLAEQFETETTEVRNIIVDFTDTIHGLVQIGTEVEVEDILCTIEDQVTAHSNLLGDASQDTLRAISGINPPAKVKGVVEQIEVFYHGDIEDMSPSLQELTMESDRNRKRLARALKKPYTTGRVSGSLNVEGRNLAPNKANIRVSITSKRGASQGDKFVFGNQLKSINGRVMHGQNTTASGEEIDAIFGYLSVSNRIVGSAEIIGTTSKLMQLATKRAIAAYRKG